MIQPFDESTFPTVHFLNIATYLETAMALFIDVKTVQAAR